MAQNSDPKFVVAISRRGADRIRAGHVWVYRSDVVEAQGIEPGALVLVQEQTGAGPQARSDKNVRAARPASRQGAARPRPPHALGSALYSTSSEIAIRMISSKPVTDIGQLVRERVRAAIAYRERFVKDTNAYRLIFSEGDFLPGLIVDRYNDILSLQVLTQAMDSDPMRNAFVSELQDALKPAAIFERVDPRVRKLEQLPEKESGIVGGAGNSQSEGSSRSNDAHVGAGVLTRPAALVAAMPDEHSSPARTGVSGPTHLSVESQNRVTTEFHMNGVRFLYDALAGQKTGAFLDQRENYAAGAQYARGEALDAFCYQGGFALHLARACEKVTGVDSSRPALEAAEQNAGLNGCEIEWIEANAFDLLRDYSDAGRKFDTIVLDPPAFAKSRQNRETALRGYKELNLRALKMLRPGGVLVSCSCSYHVSAADLLEVLASAAQDSHRILRILENRGAAKDHPSVLGVPETAYLKCVLATVS